MQVAQALAEGRAEPHHSALRDVRLGQAVAAVRVVEGVGVEVDMEGQVGCSSYLHFAICITAHVMGSPKKLQHVNPCCTPFLPPSNPA